MEIQKQASLINITHSAVEVKKLVIHTGDNYNMIIRLTTPYSNDKYNILETYTIKNSEEFIQVYKEYKTKEGAEAFIKDKIEYAKSFNYEMELEDYTDELYK